MLTPTTSYKKDWSLSKEAFDKILLCLDRDRERAGEKYERIRLKLTKLFNWRGCALPEELADKTIDRVARRIQEGAELHTSDPYLYFHGVALNVLREHWKKPEDIESLEALPASALPSRNPIADREAQEEEEDKELKLRCLDSCLRKLETSERNLVCRYHLSTGAEARPSGRDRDQGGEKPGNIEGRRMLAKSQGIPINALRIRVYRIRARLERCIYDCMEQQPES